MKRQMVSTEAILPKTDPRVKLLAAKIKKENFRPDALIEILHTAQNIYGYLPPEVLAYITATLKLPPSRVFATATFYHFFSLKAKGAHNCIVCTGTACYVKGAHEIIYALSQKFGIIPGQVTSNEKLGIQVARCIGACGLAPAVVIDNEVQGKANAEDVIANLTHKMEQP